MVIVWVLRLCQKLPRKWRDTKQTQSQIQRHYLKLNIWQNCRKSSKSYYPTFWESTVSLERSTVSLPRKVQLSLVGLFIYNNNICSIIINSHTLDVGQNTQRAVKIDLVLLKSGLHAETNHTHLSAVGLYQSFSLEIQDFKAEPRNQTAMPLYRDPKLRRSLCFGNQAEHGNLYP